MSRRVVVTGLGLICGVGHTSPEVWTNILAGKSGIAKITHFDATNFACQIAEEIEQVVSQLKLALPPAPWSGRRC